MGCDAFWDTSCLRLIRFNPRTHMGCDSTGLYISPEEVMFQSTHPHGVRRWTIALSLHKILFQSTHPHGVRQGYFSVRSRLQGFNPRTHMGCDRQTISQMLWASCFNPRTHMGCDFQQGFAYGREGVSIHAPTWGATLVGMIAFSLVFLFQSTHPHGVRRDYTHLHIS